MRSFLLDVLHARTTDAQRAWMENAVSAVSADPTDRSLLRAYTEASRFLGKNALNLTSEELSRLALIDPMVVTERWACDDLGRVLLLLAMASRLDHSAFVDRTVRCYRLGDSREQQSWLRGLSLLPGCEAFLDLAIDSCRTNILPLFESIATDNPYPARYFPDLNFNQMVMKCLFNAVPLNRVAGLEGRLNPELSRMAEDYAKEREAAGRSVPADIQKFIHIYK
jgi:hypothetical protein